MDGSQGAPSGIVRTRSEEDTSSLDRPIAAILGLMRDELVMDIVFISRMAGAHVIVSHASADAEHAGIQGLRHPRDQSFCQRVLDGRLPAMIPDVAALCSTHDVPATPVAPGAYMAAPILLQDGTLYGTLCCIGLTVARGLGERHHQRLQMSARQIARLVDEAGGR